MTFLFYSNYNIGDIYPSFNVVYLRKSTVLKWKTLLPHIKVCFSEVFYIIILYLQPFEILKWRKVYGGQILQNLSPLPTSLKVEPLAKPKTGLKFFVNTTKPKTRVLAVLGPKLETKVSTLSLSPG